MAIFNTYPDASDLGGTERFLASQSGGTINATPSQLSAYGNTLNISTQTDNYTLALSDFATADGKPSLLLMNKASAVTVTVPPNGTIAIPIGKQIAIKGIGAGLVTIAQGAGVTVTASAGALSSRDVGQTVVLTKTGTNTWYLENGSASTYASTSGTNTYTATVTNFGGYGEGVSLTVKFGAANTGASTLNINGLGAVALKKQDGSALVDSDIFANQILTVVHNGTNFILKDLPSGVLHRVILSGDVVNNNASADTIADITGLSFPVKNGLKYKFRFSIFYDSAATATGARFTINGPAKTKLGYNNNFANGATAAITSFRGDYDLPAAASTSSPATASNFCSIEGFVIPSADGTVIARFASEISSSAITALGGYCFVDYYILP